MAEQDTTEQQVTEETQEEQATVDESQEEVIEDEEQPEQEQQKASESEIPVGESIDPELLKDAVPEISDFFHTMSPQAREEYLLKKLAASRADGALGQGTTVQTEATAESSRQSIRDIPTIDRKSMKSRIAQAFEENDGAAASEVLAEFFDYSDSILQNVAGALQESSQRQQQFRQEIDKLHKPAILKAALKEVISATEADIPAAIEYLERGGVTNHKAALALAANDREYRTQKAKKPTRTPSQEATRKAAARVASDTGSQARYPAREQGTAMPIIEFNPESVARVADAIIPEKFKKPKRRKG